MAMAQKTRSAPKVKRRSKAQPYGASMPTWEIAYLFPAQGTWTEEDYFNLDGAWEGFPRVELSHGRLEVLPMPTELHQIIILVLLRLLDGFTAKYAPGLVLPPGMRMKLKSGKFREPDLVYMKAENAHRRRKKYWMGADLVMEVVSGDAKDVERDWETKPKEYAQAGISEYWIIDPEKMVIRVLSLKAKAYKLHGDFGPGQRATSVLLPGFSVLVDEVLPPGSDAE
jgi:Uma2 family endonuclease